MRLKASWGFWFFLATTILAIVVAWMRTDEVMASRATNQWHKQFREAAFRVMYRQASPFLQANISEEVFTDRMSKLRRRIYGQSLTIKKSDRTGPFGNYIETEPGGTYVRELYIMKSTADRCDEYIIWVIRERKIELLSCLVDCDSKFQVHIP